MFAITVLKAVNWLLATAFRIFRNELYFLVPKNSNRSLEEVKATKETPKDSHENLNKDWKTSYLQEFISLN